MAVYVESRFTGFIPPLGQYLVPHETGVETRDLGSIELEPDG
jgi:hypothetical protein